MVDRFDGFFMVKTREKKRQEEESLFTYLPTVCQFFTPKVSSHTVHFNIAKSRNQFPYLDSIATR